MYMSPMDRIYIQFLRWAFHSQIYDLRDKINVEGKMNIEQGAYTGTSQYNRAGGARDCA